MLDDPASLTGSGYNVRNRKSHGAMDAYTHAHTNNYIGVHFADSVLRSHLCRVNTLKLLQ